MLSLQSFGAYLTVMALFSIGALDAASQGILEIKLSDQVVERLADISLARADLSAKRYVFVAFGTRTTIRQGVLDEDQVPILLVVANSPSKKIYYAASVSDSRTLNTFDSVQNWNQVLKCDGKTFCREGYPLKPFREFFGKKDERKPSAVKYHPIASSLDFASQIARESSIDVIELLAFSDKSKLQEIHFDNSRNLICKWTINFTKDYSVEARVTLAKEFGYMPSRAMFFSLGNTNLKIRQKPRLLSEVRTTWKSQDSQFLPTKISAVDLTTNAGTIERHYEIDIEWKLGEELPPDFDIPVESADWREPIRALFEKDWRNWSPVDE